ncbi:hypothetical protein MPTK1_4g15580 [Marchantia polymorpha subsp. ruderalis]|uniref:Uncharacterized protein n=2 Tax=Marchantia polymorpha TaxID=3197 RepID=A0A176VED4_MARPO|nr:hypothetical protein AXG93_406s1340 [Marchantia polymorpha subsp. ruderalis]PTQ37907.1 hypothetical protein MARPO_0054s0023 [Marchantia polymorpha]BBN08921.1 hypothetical protein Mp_4g15580 [Marchantia polymorpha subsp. ruderalis]|eukprot:PTQ37907.1 hypothetical protein MARPO_0054s0023 [Marchantia polymorpha]
MAASSPTMSLWLWLKGLWTVIIDTIGQRFRCRHLPKRLPLPHFAHFTCIVTGSTGGIGMEIAREFAASGAHVILAVRNTSNGKKLIEQWTKEREISRGPEIRAEVMELDLLKLSSVRTFAQEWERRNLPLHALINNAGIFAMNVKQKFSDDGFEHHLQVNFLGNALLSILLLPSLLRGAPSRIINVNSCMHHMGFVDPEDLNITKRRYSSTGAYSGSKLAQHLFSRILHMRIPKEAGIDVILTHPGEVMTQMTRDLPKIIQKVEVISSVFRLSAAEGARGVIFCATDKQVFAYTRALREMGQPICPYFSSNCKPADVAKLANDMETAMKVWNKTLELLDLPADIVEKQFQRKEDSATSEVQS